MKIAEIISATFLLVLLGGAIALLGYRKDKRTVLRDNIFRIVIFYLILTFVVMFSLGFFTGYLKNAYSRTTLTLIDNIAAPVLIIIFMELLRYVFIGANKDKKGYIFLLVIALTLFECITTIGILKTYDLESLFHATASIILPVTVKNIVLTYLCYHVGYKVPLLYRLVVDTYIFFVPIVPNIGEYFNSMIFISLPILIYMSSFGLVDDRTKKLEPVFNKDNFTVLDIPVAILLITMICLISGYFTYTMMGVGSDSMSPKINRGDAVIIKKINKKTEIKKGDVVAYYKSKKVIVHRINKINKDGSFATKGDANNAIDKDSVKRKQIKGIVKLRIPFIAYPTLWFNDLINGKG
jgi:signal peptidase I